jgi:hypothetical protein
VSDSSAGCERGGQGKVFSDGSQRIYHYHLKKCGGTSLNSWLEWHFPDDRRWTEAVENKYYLAMREGAHPIQQVLSSLLDTNPGAYTHIPLGSILPPGTFSVTVLRNPVDRIVSQVSDWRREFAAGAQQAHTLEARAIQDAAKMSLRDFLCAHYVSPLRGFFDNYQTRALVTVPGEPTVEGDASSLLPAARVALERDYRVVGLTECMMETRAAICSYLGLVPDMEAGGARNATGGRFVSPDELRDASEIVHRITAVDRELYIYARQLFFNRHAKRIQYSESDFEAVHAAEATQRLRPILRDRSAFMSVRDTILASGIHGRDGAGTENCAIWTGPSKRTVLYMPCPAGKMLKVKLWIRGYAAERIRSQVRFEIDDRLTSHTFASSPESHEIVEMDATPKRPFLKLTILVDETLTSLESDGRDGDERKRGLAFDGYGWSTR